MPRRKDPIVADLIDDAEKPVKRTPRSRRQVDDGDPPPGPSFLDEFFADAPEPTMPKVVIPTTTKRGRS